MAPKIREFSVEDKMAHIPLEQYLELVEAKDRLNRIEGHHGSSGYSGSDPYVEPKPKLEDHPLRVYDQDGGRSGYEGHLTIWLCIEAFLLGLTIGVFLTINGYFPIK
jgi:hypothetical protein